MVIDDMISDRDGLQQDDNDEDWCDVTDHDNRPVSCIRERNNDWAQFYFKVSMKKAI